MAAAQSRNPAGGPPKPTPSVTNCHADFDESLNDDGVPDDCSYRRGWWRRRPGRLIAAAVSGWAVLSQQAPLLVAGIAFPLGEILLAVLVFSMVKRKAPTREFSPLAARLETCQPFSDPARNAFLAARIAGILAVVPVGYFIYTSATQLRGQLQHPGPEALFIVAGVISQWAGWILTGLLYGALGTRLPGKNGPVRAFVLAGAWFAAALAVQAINAWTGHSTGWTWSFPGFQLLLFLVVFSVIWDAFILHPTLDRSSLADIFNKVTRTYNVKRTRAVVLYAIPALLALLALGQQVVTGHGADFVEGVLKFTLAGFGG